MAKISQEVLAGAGFKNLAAEAPADELDKASIAKVRANAQAELDSFKAALQNAGDNAVLNEHYKDQTARKALLDLIAEVEKTSAVAPAPTGNTSTLGSSGNNSDKPSGLKGGNNGAQEKPKDKSDSIQNSPVVLNYIRAIELGLIGATPKENLTAFSTVKGHGVIGGTWNGLKASNDRIPKAMNWANYLHTNPWIRPDLEHAISLEKATNKALLANKDITHATREALQLREQFLTQMSEALGSNNHARFGDIATEYRAAATSGLIAREAVHIDEAIGHSILKENIPEHEKSAIKTKEKAEKSLAESSAKIEELKGEHKTLETDLKIGDNKKLSIEVDIAETDRLIAEERVQIGINEASRNTANQNHQDILDKIDDLKNGTHKTAAINLKDGQITSIESQIQIKNTELASSTLADTQRIAIKDERSTLQDSLGKLQTEKINLIAAEETRLNRLAEGYSRTSEQLTTKIDASNERIRSHEAEKSKLSKQKRELGKELGEKGNRKDAIKDASGNGEKKTQEDLKTASEQTIKNHESLQKAKTALEVELAKPHPDRAEVNHLRTEYERLAGSGAVPIPADRPARANVRMHEVEKDSFEKSKVEVERIESRLAVIEGEIHTKLSAIDEQLKAGKISKTQAYTEVDRMIAPYNREFETIQRAGLANLEHLNSDSFKKILGQSKWLKSLNTGNTTMDKFDSKIGKWAGLAVVGLMVKHGTETGMTEELKNDLIDAGVGIIPIIGGVHDLKIAWEGKDLNNRKVEGWDRTGRVAFGVLGLTGVGSIVKWIGKGAQGTELALKTASVMNTAKKIEQVGEGSIRLLEPVRLAGRPIMYTTLGVTLYTGVLSPILDKTLNK